MIVVPNRTTANASVHRDCTAVGPVNRVVGDLGAGDALAIWIAALSVSTVGDVAVLDRDVAGGDRRSPPSTFRPL